MNDLNGKKLLILGANVTECFVVNRAKDLGIYTIVTDNNTDIAKSPAKEIADEYWDISWSDINQLAEKCREANVDGVIAGFSEFRVENQIKLCEELNLPCPISAEQLEITRDKLKFKKACRHSGLPLVPEYTEDSAFRHLPVIVKPVDRAGSIGITVAYTEEELVNACRIARDASPTGEIIIEKYMEGCVKFDVYYLLVDGTAYLLGSNDTMMCPPQKGHEILQSAWIFPSKRQADFIKRYQEQITKFFKSLDMKDGYITMSAFRDEKDCFYIFESGFRLSGELSFEYTKHAYGIDYLDNLISYALSGSMGMFKLPEKRNVTPLLVINHFAKDGEVKSCSGLSEETDSYWTYDYLKKIRVLKNTNGNGISKIAMSFIPVYALESALKSNMEINATLDVCNENDESLIYFRNTDSRIKNFIS